MKLARRCLMVVELLLVTCASACAQAAHSQSPPPVSGIIAELQQKRFQEAIEDSGIQLKKFATDPRLWTLRGMAWNGLGKSGEALGAFEHALKIAPKYLPALEGAAQTAYAQGGSGARPYLVRILEQRPEDPTTHAMLGVISYNDRDCSTAVRHFEQAGPVIGREASALAQYGTCLGALKRAKEAIPVLQESLGLNPQQSDARYNLALCQQEADQPTEALATLQPVLDAGEKSEKFYLLAASLYESTDESQKAIDALRQAIVEHPREPGAYLDFAYLSYNHASPQVGIDILNVGVEQLPRDGRLYLVRGILRCQVGDFSKAMEDFDKANSLDPRLSFVQVAMGIAQSQRHQGPEALAAFRAAAKRHPEDALTQYLLAEAISEQAKPDDEELLAAGKRAIALDPKLVAAHDLLAGVYLERGEKQQAISHSEAALKVNGTDQQALYHLILALRDSPRKDEIPALMKRLTEARKAESSEAKSNGARKFQFSEVPDSRVPAVQ